MEFTVEAAGPCRKRVKVHIPSTSVSEEFTRSYRQWSRTVPLPGFRPGKAPRALVEKKFGAQVTQDVKQSLLDKAFEEALREQKLSPITDPEVDLEGIDVKPEADLDFDFVVTVKPEFELPDMKTIEVEVPPADPTDDEVDTALLDLRKRKATLRPLEKGAVESGDVVTLKVRGTTGGMDVLQEESLPYEVGSHYLGGLIVEDLDDGLVGASAGGKATGKAFPPPHADDHPLAGHEVEVEAEIVEVKRPDLPDVDDAFAKSWDFDSRDELLDAVRTDVRRHKERERDRLIENLALHQLIQQADFELPEELIEREAEDLARRVSYDLQQQGKTDEEIAREVTEARRRRSEDAGREMKAFFLLDKIVEKERLLVTEGEVQEQVNLMASRYGRPVEEMRAYLEQRDLFSSLRGRLRERKVMEALRKRQEEPARKSVHAALILDAVAAAESIEIEREAVDERIRLDAARLGETPEKLRERLRGGGGLAALVGQLRRERALDYLMSVANIQYSE